MGAKCRPATRCSVQVAGAIFPQIHHRPLDAVDGGNLDAGTKT